jgi:hypothetical protein
VRATLRALTARLVAAELRLRQDTWRRDDPDLAALAHQLAAERNTLEALGRDLDARIADVKRACDAIAAGHVATIIASARRDRPTPPRDRRAFRRRTDDISSDS